MESSKYKDAIVKYLALTDLYYFITKILGYDLLEVEVHKPLCDFIQHNKYKDLLDLEPRDHFKTTVVSVGFVIWSICRDPNIKILLNHGVAGKAREVLAAIKTHFETNPMLRRYFGDMVGSPWGESKITVSKRTRIAVEPTLSIGAVDKEATGGHYNLIVNDDLAGLKDRYSAKQREKVLRYLKAVAYLKDKSDCREITIGTRWHEDDVYNFIIEKRKKVKVRIRKAEVKKGVPYFKSRFTWNDLKDLEEDDPGLYAAVMMNDPRPMKDQLYHLDELNKFDYNSYIVSHVIGYVDPAFGKTNEGEPCYFNFCIANIIGDKAYIIEWISNKKKPKDNEILIVNKVKEYNMKMLGVESNAAQSIWCENIKTKLEEEELFVSFEEINHSANKDRRIQSMHGKVLNNTLFRRDWEGKYKESMNQLLMYPQHKYKDAPDGLEGLLSMGNIANDINISFV